MLGILSPEGLGCCRSSQHISSRYRKTHSLAVFGNLDLARSSSETSLSSLANASTATIRSFSTSSLPITTPLPSLCSSSGMDIGKATQHVFGWLRQLKCARDAQQEARTILPGQRRRNPWSSESRNSLRMREVIGDSKRGGPTTDRPRVSIYAPCLGHMLDDRMKGPQRKQMAGRQTEATARRGLGKTLGGPLPKRKLVPRFISGCRL